MDHQSNTADAHVAHHFDDAAQQFESARLGMWLFLVTEVMFFGGVFAGYLIYRGSFPAAFAEGSRHLSVLWGTINTAVLLCSSLSMALAVYSAQIGDRRKIVTFLSLTILLGAIFLGIKAFEYSEKFEHHLVPGPHFELAETDNPDVKKANVQLFYCFYFGMTGLHALHMVIGVAILGVLIYQAKKGVFSPEYFTPVEMTGLYWHFVDIVWVFLFPLLYLIG
jgi:cytochrome c oxidase subunit III